MKNYIWVVGIGLLLTLPLCAKPESVSLRTQDGWSLAATYAPAQEGQRTVVLLHDIGKSRQAFSALIEKLEEKQFGYVALDLRGHGESNNLGIYTSFAKEGVDNDYNQMVRDVNAVIEYLKEKGVTEETIFLVGAGMGANIAAKAASLWPAVGGIALLTPVTNFRDVLPIPALRVYTGPVFIAAAADDKKTFLEASVLRNVAFLNSGEGNVTFATAYDKKGHELLDSWVMPELLQWLQNPQKPVVSPDILPEEQEPNADYIQVESSQTEEALVPSVLQ